MSTERQRRAPVRRNSQKSTPGSVTCVSATRFSFSLVPLFFVPLAVLTLAMFVKFLLAK
jgi:hypothetical protein